MEWTDAVQKCREGGSLGQDGTHEEPTAIQRCIVDLISVGPL